MRRNLYLLLVLVLAASACAYFHPARQCEVCKRPIHLQTHYKIHLEDGQHKEVCCPRCGLHFQRHNAYAAGAEVADYHSGEMIDAQQAHYVENSLVMFCCKEDRVKRDATGAQFQLSWDRCMPSLVAFKDLEEAERFRTAQGGVLKSYRQLQQEF